MKSSHLFLSVVVTVAASMCGCTAPAADSTVSTPADAPVTSSSSSAAATGKVASASQYGAVVAPLRKDLSLSVDELSHCAFGSAPTLACTIRLSAANMQVMSVGFALQSAQNPAVPSYIGSPQGEVRTLVDRTQSAATAVEAEYSRAEACISTPTGQGCGAKLAALNAKIRGFSTDLATWSRYGG